MGKPLGIPRRVVNRLFPTSLRMGMLSLVKQRIVRAEHLKSNTKLVEVLIRNIDKAVDKMEFTVAIEQEFIEEAVVAWKKDKKLVSIVLYAAAVEQLFNQTYAVMLKAHGLNNDEIEKIVRSLNIEPKMSWLLKLIAKKEFPKALAKRLRTIFELRNSIVHFKGIRAHPDAGLDSYSKIENEVGKLKRLSLSRDFRLLEKSLWKILLEKDPDFDLANKATEIILSCRQKAKFNPA